MLKLFFTLIVLALTLTAWLFGCSTIPQRSLSDHFDGKTFVNSPQEPANAGMWEINKRFILESSPGGEPIDAIPWQPVNWGQWAGLPVNDIHVMRLGHSSLMLKIAGETWLIDPVFSERTSPVQWAGPKRFHPIPFKMEDFPAVQGIVLSHDHYDHLDTATIKALQTKVQYFVAPLGVGARLQGMGVPKEKITELDWWQSAKLGNMTLTAAPAQHFSGRTLTDKNETLWASWSIKARAADKEQSVFYSGDSGYSPAFKTIGQRLGPFDLSLIETGAYDLMWRGIHMLPEESVQAHIDSQSKIMLPVHNGTFNLAFHAWQDPFERVSVAAKKQGVTLTTPIVGEPVSLLAPLPQKAWWVGLK